MKSVNVYLRQRSRLSSFSLRRLLAVFALLATLALLSVLLSAWRVAYADGSGVGLPSSASSSAAPSTQVPPETSTGVYTGCQLLVPSRELPESGR